MQDTLVCVCVCVCVEGGDWLRTIECQQNSKYPSPYHLFIEWL